MFDAPSVLSEMHLEHLCFASAKCISTNCTDVLQLPNDCQQRQDVVLRRFP